MPGKPAGPAGTGRWQRHPRREPWLPLRAQLGHRL